MFKRFRAAVLAAAAFIAACAWPGCAGAGAVESAEKILGPVAAAEQPLTPGSPLYRPANPGDAVFLEELRAALGGAALQESGSALERAFVHSSFPKKFHGFVLSIHSPGKKRFKSVSTKRSEWEDIRRAVSDAAKHPGLKKFAIADPKAVRLQIDFILAEPVPVPNGFGGLRESGFGAQRFELGVDGLVVEHGKKRVWFLPGEAFSDSAMGIGQLAAVVGQNFPKNALREASCARFKTESWVSWHGRWLRLYRGYPVLGPLTRAAIERTAREGADYLVRTQKEDGRFLYYYDAKLDSFVDHEHPQRDPAVNPYYNELRHAGGILLLLFDYEKTRDPAKLAAARKALAWLKTLYVRYPLPGGAGDAQYVYYNHKSKLGGSGLALYALTEHRRLTGDASHDDDAHRLARHVLSQIMPSGEFFYYNVYLDEPVTTAERNARHFSFYYPGEALIGLSGYFKGLAPEEAKPQIAEKIRLAMDFLVVERPKRYARLFTKLPSDSWLMQAVNDLWDSPQLRDERWNEMVFADADKLAKMMYTEEDAMYPDYVGSYYYDYGDYPYADGARDEGFLGALELALKIGDAGRAKRYYASLKKAAWAALHLVNTPESMYAAPNPDLAIGGIRFKHTRQWFRVDTIQHVAAFYFKFLPYVREKPERS